MNVVGSSAGTMRAQGATQHGWLPGSRVVAEGFVLDELDARWSLLRHECCGKSTRLVNATSDRVGWYVTVHRCGPVGSSWDGTATAYYPHETCALVRYLVWLVSSTEPATFTDPACNTAARDAVEVLRATLIAAENIQAR